MKFKGEFDFLSNFYNAPFTVGGVSFPTVEHFFQAHKATNKGDFERIINADSPGRAKFIGRKIELRDNWNSRRINIMKKGIYEKFRQNEDLRKKLLSVDEEIVEHNTWGDRYWGVCNGEGKNMLGKILQSCKDYFKE